MLLGHFVLMTCIKSADTEITSGKMSQDQNLLFNREALLESANVLQVRGHVLAPW